MLITKTKHPKPKCTKPISTNALKASFALSLLEDMHFTCRSLPVPYNGQHAFLYRSSKQKAHIIIKKIDPILGKFNSYTKSLIVLLIFFFRFTSTNINYDTTSRHAFRISVGILG